jgi:CRISPR-associated protein Cas2
MLIVVCYDIAEDLRRRRVSDELENFGGRVQDSVFECLLEEGQLKELQERLARIIHEEEDRLGYYPLCPKDALDIIVDGQGELCRDWDYHIV